MIRHIALKFRQFAVAYVSRWWMPSLVSLIALGILSLSLIANLLKFRLGNLYYTLSGLQDTLFWVLDVSWLGILLAAVWDLAFKRWKAGAFQFLMLVFIWGLSILVCAVIAVVVGYGPDEDSSADKLTTPTNTETR